MDILKSLFLGLVQGATEFLPVSSSGHLAVFRHIFHMNLDSGVFFDVMLHFGTLISLIIVFRQDILSMIREFFGIIQTAFANLLVFIKHRNGDTRYTYFKVVNSSYRKLVLMVLISTVPTGILGALGSSLVDKASGHLWLVGIFLLITSLLLFIADRYPKGMTRVKNATYSSAFILGIAQGIATMPGLSRSGTTIATGILLGYNKKLAVKYSFIMSIPAVIGAIVFEIKDIKTEAFGSAAMPGYLLGTVAAAITGYFCLKFMLKFIRSRKYIGFSIYCLLMGMLSIGYSIFAR